MLEVLLRAERPGDRDAVRALNERAFGGHEEADLVEALHRQQAAAVALVAEANGVVVGHIVFSPVHVECPDGKTLLGLAPMAVEPAHQKQGIGSRLVVEGLARSRAACADAVVVLGTDYLALLQSGAPVPTGSSVPTPATTAPASAPVTETTND